MTQETTTADLAISAEWVIPVAGEVLPHASVIVKDGRIIDLLPSAQAAARYQVETRFDLPHHALIPGLINLHCRAATTLLRGQAAIPGMRAGTYRWPLEKRLLSERFVRDGSLLGCAEMLAGGVTCFSDAYFYPQAVAEAALQAGMRANIGLTILDSPSNYASDATDYLHKGLAVRDGWRGQALLSASLAPQLSGMADNQVFEQILTYAEQLALGIHVNLHESAEEIRQSLARYGMRPLRRLLELGLLGPNLVAAHCVQLERHEIDLLREHGCHVAHCPTSDLKLTGGVAPLGELLNAGVNVGFGTGGADVASRLDVFTEMRLAALQARGADDTALPARQALTMATLGAARALGLDADVGSIESGKYADLAAVRLDTLETLPCLDPVAHLVYAAGREHVTHTWVAGALRYQQFDGRDRLYAAIEPIELQEIAATWRARLMQEMND